MRKIFILLNLVGTLTYVNIFAQQPVNIQRIRDLDTTDGSKFYLNQIPYDGRAIEFDGAKLDPSNFLFDGTYIAGKPIGKIKKRFANHKLMYEKNYNKNGNLDGNQLFYYENGQKQEEAIYSDGKRSGKFISYHDNGKIKRSVIYNNGLPVDTLIKDFDDTGQLTQVEIRRSNGNLIIFQNYMKDKIIERAEESNAKKWQGQYDLNMQKNGKWSFFEGSKLIREISYIIPPDDYSITEYFASGNKKSETIFKNGKENGRQMVWDESGNAKDNYYVDGILDLYHNSIIKNYILTGKKGLYLYKPVPQENKIIKVSFDDTFSDEEGKTIKSKIEEILTKYPFTALADQEYNNYQSDTIQYIIECNAKSIEYKPGGSYYSEFQKKTFNFEVCTVSFWMYIKNSSGEILDRKNFKAPSEPNADRKAALKSSLKNGSILDRLKDGYLNIDIPKFLKPKFPIES